MRGHRGSSFAAAECSRKGVLDRLPKVGIQAMGLGNATIHEERMDDLRRVVRRFIRRAIGEAAQEYRNAYTGDSDV